MRAHALTVLAFCLPVFTSAPPALAQSLGPEVDLTTPYPTSTGGTQFLFVLTTDRTGYLVVYSDRTVAGARARATRLAADGTFVADVAMQLPHVPRDVACNGAGDCVAVATETAWNPATSQNDYHTYVMRFRDDGASIDTSEVMAAGMRVSDAEIETTPTGFLMATQIGLPGAGQVSLTPVPASGALGTPVVFASAYYPTLACGGAACLLFDDGAAGWQVERVGFDGVAIGTPATIPMFGGTWQNTALRVAGTGWVIVTNAFVGGGYQFLGYVIDAAGTVGTPMTLAGATANDVPTVACDSTGACILELPSGAQHRLGVWNGGAASLGLVPGGNVWLRCVAAASCLRLREPPLPAAQTVAVETLTYGSTGVMRTPVASGFGTGPDVTTGPLAIAGAADGSLALSARVSGATSGWSYDLVAQPIDPTGTPASGPGGTLGSFDATTGARMALARSSTGYGVVLSGSQHTTFQSVRADGVLVDLPVDLMRVDLRTLSLAWNGTSYLLAAIDSTNHLTVQRLDAIGQRLDMTPIPIAMASDADVASDGNDFLVVWSNGTVVRGQRLSPMAMPLDGAMGFLVRDHPNISPRVAFGATEYVTAWLDTPTTMTGTPEVRATRIAQDGTVRDLGGTALDTLPAGLINFLALDVGMSGDTALVAWAQPDNSATPRTLGATLVVFSGGAFASRFTVIDDPIVAASGNISGNGAIVVGGGGPPLVVYSRGMTDAAHAPAHVRMRVYDDGTVMVADAGSPDAGTDDAASESDGSIISDATVADAPPGTADAGESPASSPSCGCRAGARGAPIPFVVLALLAYVTRLRRRPAGTASCSPRSCGGRADRSSRARRG